MLSRRLISSHGKATRAFSGGVEHHHVVDKNLKEIIQPPNHILRNGEFDAILRDSGQKARSKMAFTAQSHT
jgi:hypothetical protein